MTAAKTIEMICIGCPLGCPLEVTVNGEEILVKGNTCKNGEIYAKKEVLHPERMLTSTVPVDGGNLSRVPVKTAASVPKERIFDCMEAIHKVRVTAPVAIGDTVLENCAGTGVDIVATGAVKSKLPVQILYRDQKGGFAPFYEKMRGKRIALVYDENTKPFADQLLSELKPFVSGITEIYFPEKELVPEEHVYETVIDRAEGTDYVLAVGSGSLNDVCKYAGTVLGIPSGVLATAASMDGYLSKGAALIEKGKKVTETVHMPEDVLVDSKILAEAPRLMTAAGFGDIVGKYTCLADWNLAHILKNEPIHREAYEQMIEARNALMDSFEKLKSYSLPAVVTLMDALLAAGTSMAVCGNSRPASGSEHHQSHYLEMDFVKRGEPVPPHGVKVAIGTLVSLTLYQDLKKRLEEGSIEVEDTVRQELLELIETLPSVDHVKEMLVAMGCPVRFSEIGVRRETMEQMLSDAWTVRDRYTILTLYHDLGLMDEVKPMLMEQFY